MKTHSKFFLIFFCFAIFFSVTAYLVQDSLFRSYQANEQLRINEQYKYMRSMIEEDNKSDLLLYVKNNGISLAEIFYYDNRVVINDFEDHIFDFETIIKDDYTDQESITNACKLINYNDNGVLYDHAHYLQSSYIIEKFCVKNRLYITVSAYTEYESAIKLLQETYVPIIIGTLIVSAVLAYMLAGYISKPIRRISVVIRQLSNLNFNSKIEFVGDDEIGQLAQDINVLNDKFKYAINKLESSLLDEKKSRERQVQLFANMSHELKTPIAILKGTLEGIKDQIGPYKDPMNFIDEMIEETETMEDIVLHLLSYAKFSVNDVKLSLKPYHLEDLLEEAVYNLQYIIDEKEINVNMDIVDGLVSVDFTSISMVFKNIVENAVYYSDKGATIDIESREFKDYMSVKICNYGVNIPNESMTYIFEPFYRADDSRLKFKKGTGLGLTIVRQVLEQHNSNFTLFNVNDGDEKAVCFELTLKKYKSTELEKLESSNIID